tara:strand:+ start:15468 stop:15650 length:183 start_codon:yes stop_codon:yes gene_type:complete
MGRSFTSTALSLPGGWLERECFSFASFGEDSLLQSQCQSQAMSGQVGIRQPMGAASAINA